MAARLRPRQRHKFEIDPGLGGQEADEVAGHLSVNYAFTIVGMHLGQRAAARRQSHVDMRDAVFEVDLTLRLEAVRTVETL